MTRRNGARQLLNEKQNGSQIVGRGLTNPKKAAPPPISRLKQAKKLIAFGWYGGKFSQKVLSPILKSPH